MQGASKAAAKRAVGSAADALLREEGDRRAKTKFGARRRHDDGGDELALHAAAGAGALRACGAQERAVPHRRRLPPGDERGVRPDARQDAELRQARGGGAHLRQRVLPAGGVRAQPQLVHDGALAGRDGHQHQPEGRRVVPQRLPRGQQLLGMDHDGACCAPLAAALALADHLHQPEHFKLAGYQTFGGGKTFHPGSPKNWDEPTSWTPNATVDEGYDERLAAAAAAAAVAAAVAAAAADHLPRAATFPSATSSSPTRAGL